MLYRKFWSALRWGPAYTTIIAEPSGQRMAKIVELMAEGQLKVKIDRAFPLTEARSVCVAALDGVLEIFACSESPRI